MRILIAEDEATSREIIYEFLSPYGMCDLAKDGQEAIDAFKIALEQNEPYDLICMDIMMPKINGQQALREIRKIEKNKGIRMSNCVKVIMTTALSDKKNVLEAFYQGGAAKYIVKPIKEIDLINELRNLDLIK